jgi:hypothetical protein
MIGFSKTPYSDTAASQGQTEECCDQKALMPYCRPEQRKRSMNPIETAASLFDQGYT